MDRKLEADYGLLPRGPSAGTVRGKSVGSMDLLPVTNSIVPGVMRSLLQSRVDNMEMLEWQEGGGEEEAEAEAAAEQVEMGAEKDAPAADQAPPARKFNQATICGIDKRPFFPTVLFLSLTWSMCMTCLQHSIVLELFGSAVFFYFLAMYIITIGAALYTSLSNPGLLPEEQYKRLQAGEIRLPERAHKHWLYKRPVLRFHQYCRWVTNAIGYRNHRPYMVMLLGFVGIAVSDAVMDLILIPASFVTGSWTCLGELLLVAHLLYSVYFAWYSGPLLRQHTSFICRNELTQEWKRDEFYVMHDEETGEPIPVNELDTETYNQGFDANAFEYDGSRNKYDQGDWMQNCIVFWLTPRDDDGTGEF